MIESGYYYSTELFALFEKIIKNRFKLNFLHFYSNKEFYDVIVLKESLKNLNFKYRIKPVNILFDPLGKIIANILYKSLIIKHMYSYNDSTINKTFEKVTYNIIMLKKEEDLEYKRTISFLIKNKLLDKNIRKKIKKEVELITKTIMEAIVNSEYKKINKDIEKEIKEIDLAYKDRKYVCQYKEKEDFIIDYLNIVHNIRYISKKYLKVKKYSLLKKFCRKKNVNYFIFKKKLIADGFLINNLSTIKNNKTLSLFYTHQHKTKNIGILKNNNSVVVYAISDSESEFKDDVLTMWETNFLDNYFKRNRNLFKSQTYNYFSKIKYRSHKYEVEDFSKITIYTERISDYKCFKMPDYANFYSDYLHTLYTEDYENKYYTYIGYILKLKDWYLKIDSKIESKRTYNHLKKYSEHEKINILEKYYDYRRVTIECLEKYYNKHIKTKLYQEIDNLEYGHWESEDDPDAEIADIIQEMWLDLYEIQNKATFIY